MASSPCSTCTATASSSCRRRRGGRTGPSRSLRTGYRTAAVRGPTTLDEVRPLDLRPVVRGTRGASNETPATSSATGPWSAPRCDMPSMTETAGPSSASPPRHGSSHRATASSWTPQLPRSLPLVVDNEVPQITIPNLGSHILAIIRQRLPLDWTERYNTAPVLGLAQRQAFGAVMGCWAPVGGVA